MPLIKKICKISGREFEVSMLEQELRKKLTLSCFGADALPDVHQYERMRSLMSWRNLNSLYNGKCDLCGKFTLSMYGPQNKFPIYCLDCWFSDKWAPPEQEIDWNRPFFEQFGELRDKTPHPALSVVQSTMENSPYNNNCSQLKNCYMCFDVNGEEDCMYMTFDWASKNSLDCFNANHHELCYEVAGGDTCYNVKWSMLIDKCLDSSFIYNCSGSSNCFMSAEIKNKNYVFRGKQLTKEEYEKEFSKIDFGSYAVVEQLKKEFQEMIKSLYKIFFHYASVAPDCTGNYIFDSKNVVDSYFVGRSENLVNCSWVGGTKDSLDMANFGGTTELCFDCVVVGGASRIFHSWNCWTNVSELFYCYTCIGSANCFGCANIWKGKNRILNKEYSKEEYVVLKERLVKHMGPVDQGGTGEWGKFFPQSLNPFGYNETVAQSYFPLERAEVEKRGFNWVEKPIPQFTPDKIYAPVDNIKDTRWEDIDGKVIICKESGRPFKIINQEFDFYKKRSIPLPRLHPDVRLHNRFPRNEIYNLHEAKCTQCGMSVQTSMPQGQKVLCQTCYTKVIY